MLLAAGRSTRLGALGAAVPKPLVPVCGYPAIRFGLHAAARAGARRAVINVFHRGDLLRQTLGDGTSLGIFRLDYSVEEELLGTGGGLAAARPLFAPGPVVVMNAKVVADLDLPALIARPTRVASSSATMLLRDDPDARRWGAIACDATGRVVGILDARSPRPPEGPVTERMFTGVHVLAPALLDRLRPVVCDVIRDAYIPALLAGETISAVTLARLLRRALDARALPGRQPRAASQPGLARGSARAAGGRRRRARRSPPARASRALPHRRRRHHRGRRRGRARRRARHAARASLPARASSAPSSGPARPSAATSPTPS